jgi:hypothetical protein
MEAGTGLIMLRFWKDRADTWPFTHLLTPAHLQEEEAFWELHELSADGLPQSFLIVRSVASSLASVCAMDCSKLELKVMNSSRKRSRR